MFPFWSSVIAPVLEAAGVRRLVEIGALRGDNTRQIIERLGSDTELHVVDPVPGFDPSELEAAFAGRYVFHRGLSLDVLPGLPPMDAALVDGDHNWYTVRNELRLLHEVSRAAGEPLPLLVLHDVGWPYGRRDLYYDPDTVPAEFRQPWARRGMRRGRRELLEGSGGLNPDMANALVEGGPRNGVMTALDDFIAEHDRPVRLVELPVYFGLAIVVEEDRLAGCPDLARELDRIEGAEARLGLMELAEDQRLRAVTQQHTIRQERDRARERLAHVTARYLRTVKAALLDEHYLENEARLAHLTARLGSGRAPDAAALRDPVRHDQATYHKLLRERTGPAGADDPIESFVPYTAMGRARLDRIERSLDALRAANVPGDLVECGTGRGGGAIFLRAWLDAHGIEGRRVWVADRFRSAPEGENAPSLPRQGVAGFRSDLNLVRDGFARFDLLDERVRFLEGPLDASLADAPIGTVAFLRIGRGLGDEARAVLERVYPRLAPGAVVFVDDQAGSAAHRAVEAFRAEHGVTAPLERVDQSTLVWRKDDDAAEARPSEPAAPPEPVVGAPRPPLAPPAPDDAVDLTVVVVFYDMKREAARTLRSLSRGYQEGVDDITYEVIAIDNGSSPGQRLDREFVESFGPEFRFIDLGEDAHPSPVMALNRGIRAGRGRAFALMIDGAHVVTPGVVRFGLTGLATYAPSIVMTQQWYIGPGQQGDAMDDGYDQAYEDRLFETINWPRAGYRLFEISHFIGDRDWLDGLWESNCIFVPRSLLEQVGGYDESFATAGGAYGNLELYERLGTSPDITVATMLGEGSFHQLHGGTTTNQPDPEERRARVFGYGQEYAEMRGRAFRGPGKPVHYIGRITSPAARRTKARRLFAEAFAAGAAAGGVDGMPTSPTPIPDELVESFTDGVWRTLPWTKTTWLGRAIESAPTDLLAYQELIHRVRPDWVIETGTGDGGRTLFLATMCDLVGHGQVLSIDAEHGDDLPAHPRIHYVEGRPHDEVTVAEALQVVGGGARALLVLGSRADRYKTLQEFEAFVHLVPVGSYAVVAETVVNGHPVWTGFGPGPAEAVKQILTTHGEFVHDPDLEKYALTFNPGGFLRRVR